ncbi:hypothetical protein TNIN_303801, partial [Trichonephila inaurata madagascariensis]
MGFTTALSSLPESLGWECHPTLASCLSHTLQLDSIPIFEMLRSILSQLG